MLSVPSLRTANVNWGDAASFRAVTAKGVDRLFCTFTPMPVTVTSACVATPPMTMLLENEAKSPLYTSRSTSPAMPGTPGATWYCHRLHVGQGAVVVGFPTCGICPLVLRIQSGH